jgi:tetratricopeptide (TPR) repeat protein
MKLAGLALALSLALANPVFAHDPHTPPATRVLGELSFPTSTKSPQAQAAFIEGMLYLHIFEYASAANAFKHAQQLDPGFAMAYWGEAMSYTHPVWNQQDMEAGRAALAKLAPSAQARAAKAGSERERDFLHSAETLYGEGDKPSRDLALLAEMEAMAKKYPQDDEVQLFLALALLGADEGKRDVPRFLRAAEISKAVYRHNPKHPGAAHYWIHGMDDPQHAAGALEAANSLAKIAPDAGHSQHMVSHIFIALGRWQDVVDANVAAMRVVNADLAAKGQPEYQCGHYAEWLQYAWLQQGKEAEAWKLLGDCERTGAAAVAWMKAHPGTPYLSSKAPDKLEESYRGALERMRSMAFVDSPAHRADLLKATSLADADSSFVFARGFAALEQGDQLGAYEAVATLAALDAADAAAQAAAAVTPAKPAPPSDPYLAIMASMLRGASLARGERVDDAVKMLREAAERYEALPFDFGPPPTVKPPRELLGEVLLAAGRKEEARAAFEKALASAPERKASLAGRAATAP